MPEMKVTARPLTVIETTRQMSRVRFDPTGRWLIAVGRDQLLHRWHFAGIDFPPADANMPTQKSDKPVTPLIPQFSDLQGHNGWMTQIAFAARSARFFSTDSWGRLIAWDASTEPPQPIWDLPAAHDGWIRDLAVNPSDHVLATGGKDKSIRLWSAADGALLQEFVAQPDESYSVAFHPNGSALVVGDLKGIVRQFDLNSQTVVREFDAKSLYLYDRIQEVGGVRVLGFDTGGKTMAVAGMQPTTGAFVQGGPAIRFFDWDTGQEQQLLKFGDNNLGYVHDLVWHPAGYWIGVCSGQPGQGNFFLHRVGEAQPFLIQTLPNCHSVALHPDGIHLAVVANAGTFGQAKSMAREGVYPGNTSPIHIYQLTTT